jgi:eukaryotic-like serine/threonine-protein kinase
MQRMRNERWTALKDAFAELAELTPDARAQRLAEIAANDAELHARLVALLHADAEAAAPAITDFTSLPDAPLLDDPFRLRGHRVGRFLVLDVLGAGGVGIVYRARDERLGRDVALKLLLPHYAHDDVARERFLNEARAASTLDHPNVCTVYEAGTSEDGRVFLAMACYTGETLRARLARHGPFPIAEAVGIATQVLHGLDAAHRAGIVHRDLKPGNLLIAADGTVRILDFGLARARDAADLTVPGVQPGTVAYMSPEQLRGHDVDARADLWALGVVLYELLTGRAPFRRGHDLATLHAILHETPLPPSQLRPEVPPALDAVVLRLLEREPAARFADADTVLATLAAGVSAAPPRRRRARIGQALMALSIGVMAFAGIHASVRDSARFDSAAVAAAAGVVQHSIAVLPFTDAAADTDYFGDGVAEEILHVLRSVPELHVSARASAYAFRHTELPLREIAARLGVRTLLGGRVQRDSGRLRITAWLVDGTTDRELWAQSFAGDANELAAMQTAIAQAVLGALELQRAAVDSVAVLRATLSHSAHEAYLHGLFHWHRRSPQSVQEAAHYFEQAIRLDSTFARAYAGLALAHAVLPVMTGTPAAFGLPNIERTAARALTFDPALADAYAALGYGYHQAWRWDDAERAFRRALELDPDHLAALQWYGEHAVKMGRADEAATLLARAVALDPLSAIVHLNHGLVLWLGGRTADAIARFEHAAALDPGMAIAQLLLFRARLFTHDFSAAAAAGRTWAALSGQAHPGDIDIVVRAVAGSAGSAGEASGSGSATAVDSAARAAALDVLRRWEEAQVRIVDVVLCAVLLDEIEFALEALERAAALRNPLLAALRAGVWTEGLHDEPRFRRLLQELGLEQ